MEQWLDIEDYEGYYQVSNYGRVRSLDRVTTRIDDAPYTVRGCILKQALSSSYLSVAFSKDSIIKNFRVHRLIAKAFIPNPENKPEVNHKDGNKQNNYSSNLEWCTSQENKQHANRLGLTNNLEHREQLSKSNRGTNNKSSKLSELDVEQILSTLNINSEITYKEVAELYGVCVSTIDSIANNKTWKHVKGIRNFDHRSTGHKGERAVNAKLKTQDVIKIREAYALNRTMKFIRELALLYKVTLFTIQAVVYYKSWRHVK